MKDVMQLLTELHVGNERQGPGSTELTLRALELSGLKPDARLRVADIGCGTGASTLVLAKELGAQVVAVDMLAAFLRQLEERAAAADLTSQITTVEADMESLHFEDESLDAIWSEGAIYNIGFERGVREWRRFLKPGGVLAVSELTWITGIRPAELQEHWDREYPEVATASSKISVLEQNGYTPVGYFVLPESAWMEGYYGPLQAQFGDFLRSNPGDETASFLLEAENAEIALYERNRAFVSYGFYVARRTQD